MIDARNGPSNSSTPTITWERPRLKGDKDIIFAGVSSESFRAVLSLIKPNGMTLDLGCGQGTLLYNLRKQYNGDICALDISFNVLKTARMLVQDANFVVGDGLKTPFKSNIFDFIQSIMVIEHVDDTLLIREIYRILKPGGIVLLTTVLRKKGAVYFYKNRKGEIVLEPTHLREYNSIEEIKSIIESNGLRVGKIRVDPLKFSPLDPVFRNLYRAFPSEVTVQLHMQKMALIVRKASRVQIPRYAMISLIAQKLLDI
jgi:SAM-dependent methyltransferase